jgi:O-antigen ligase
MLASIGQQNRSPIVKIFAYWFLLFPLLFVSHFDYLFPGFDGTRSIWKVISVAIILCIYAVDCIKRMRINKMIVMVLLYYAVLGAVTVMIGGTVIDYLKEMGTIISLCCFIDWVMRYDRSGLLNYGGLLLEILIYVNFISIILYPDGMSYIISTSKGMATQNLNWFLGYKNTFSSVILPAIVFAELRNIDASSLRMKHGIEKCRRFLLYAVSFASVVLANSSTSIVIVALFLLYFLFSQLFAYTAVFTMRNYIIVVAAIFVGIVIFRMQDSFAWLIEGILQKDLTLTGRVLLWDFVMADIRERPFFGWGYDFEAVSIGRTAIFGAHNYILEVLHKGGLFLFAFFIFILIKAVHQLMKMKKVYASQFLSWALFCILVFLQFEPTNGSWLFVFIIMISDIYANDALRCRRRVIAGLENKDQFGREARLWQTN